jgi:hypothetical protein
MHMTVLKACDDDKTLAIDECRVLRNRHARRRAHSTDAAFLNEDGGVVDRAGVRRGDDPASRQCERAGEFLGVCVIRD